MTDMTNPPATVQAALAAIMRELPAIGKDDSSPELGYRFRGIESLTRAVQPLLAKHGVIIFPQVREREVVVSQASRHPAMQDVRLTINWQIVGPDGSSFYATTHGIGRDHTDKGANKAQTQAFKYLLLHLLCISDAKDDADGRDPELEAPAVDPADNPIKVLWARVLSWRDDEDKAGQLKAVAEEHEVRLTEKALVEHEAFREALTAKLDAFDVAEAQDEAAEGGESPAEASDDADGTDTADEPETAAEPGKADEAADTPDDVA